MKLYIYNERDHGGGVISPAVFEESHTASLCCRRFRRASHARLLYIDRRPVKSERENKVYFYCKALYSLFSSCVYVCVFCRLDYRSRHSVCRSHVRELFFAARTCAGINIYVPAAEVIILFDSSGKYNRAYSVCATGFAILGK